jgi:tagatose 6-phosphate kinase
MIVTVTLNPALQVDYEAGRIAVGTANPVRRVRYRTGGRGLAVARVLQTFGHDVVAAGLAGGSAGEFIRNELARAGVATEFTRISAESRRVVAITDSATGAVTSFAEPAPYITTEELGRLATDYRALLAGATAIVLCGSLPDGLPPEIYGSFASYAADAGVPVILDAAGAALLHGAARGPELVIPEASAQEAAASPVAPALGGTPEPPLPSPDSLGAAGAVAGLTADGAEVRTEGVTWRACLPSGRGTGQELITEGRRDALVAGFVPGVALDWSWPDTLRHAVALGAAWDPHGLLDIQAYETALADVQVEQLPR